ncbi:hypothetical protein ANCCEY_02346 [Ancylostoma ceylanicum]|uniref:DDE Tnp4 domain-containing protein n=1 Tax=Ancylostoma ceylanicum TaxID=53326 RepID=A0A0D6M832_9BILA|nr:hypothetical protein ANCCEY_02346 [Ancylostoma ceylanicum]
MDDHLREEIELLFRIAAPRCFHERGEEDNERFRGRFRFFASEFRCLMGLVGDDLAPQMTRFSEVCGIRNVIGAIDGSLISMLGPSEDAQFFMCRKGFYSINLSAIGDADQSFRWISVKFPGSVHDSWVFRESRIYQEFMSEKKTGILLADSGSRAENVLFTAMRRNYSGSMCFAQPRYHLEGGGVLDDSEDGVEYDEDDALYLEPDIAAGVSLQQRIVEKYFT